MLSTGLVDMARHDCAELVLQLLQNPDKSQNIGVTSSTALNIPILNLDRSTNQEIDAGMKMEEKKDHSHEMANQRINLRSTP